MKSTNLEITALLINLLWEQYLERVPYAAKYADLVTDKGGKVIHDHIAFRTFNTHTGEQPGGISAIGHIIRVLEYRKAGVYSFPKMKLTATHFEHPHPSLPKIFVSQLEADEFPEWVQDMIHESVADTPYLISDEGIELLNLLKDEKELPVEAAEILVEALAGYFCRPWRKTPRETILKLNDVSQYAAWTLLHGNSVNHFAASINEQNVKEWPDIEITCLGLMQAGIPMKETIEGEKGSILRQTSTLAVKEDIEVLDEDGEVEKIEWTYAYYELAERGFIFEKDEKKLFTGFLGEQAAQLFKMTCTREN